jgi:hypothetical protein
MKKKIGIWLDFREANLITLRGKSETFETILSEIDTSRPKGGSRSKTPWGPMETVSEKAHLERRKHEEKIYFDKIIDAVKDADEVYIFGPAQAKEGLVKAIKEKSNLFQPWLGDVETSDSMTKNQKIAQVRDFFSHHPV